MMLLSGCGGGGGASSPVPTPPSASGGQVTLKTSMGDIVVELDAGKAPISTANFLQYVADGFYANKIFHRVVSNFVIQGGGFNAALELAPTRAAIKLEASNGLKNERGTIAMARTDAPDSATSQFYINVQTNTSLDGNYAVFGRVVAGMDVVDQIKLVPTHTAGGMPDVPVTPVVIIAAAKTK